MNHSSAASVNRLTTESSNRARPTAKNGLFTLVDQVVVSGTRFLTTVFIAQACGESALGIYALVLSVILMSLMFQQTLITTPYANFRNRMEPHAEQTYYRDVWKLSLAFSLIMTLVILLVGSGFGVASMIAGGSSAESGLGQLASTFGFSALAVPFMVGVEFFRRTWLIRMQAVCALLLDVFVSTIVISVLAVLVFNNRLSPSLVFVVMAVVNCVAVFFTTWHLVPPPTTEGSTVRQTIKKNWGFGKWIFSSEAMTFGRANLVKWIIGGFLGIGATGFYAACESLMRAINPFFLGVASVAEPTLAAGYATTGKREVRRLALKVFFIMAIGTLPICLSIVFGSKYLLMMFYGPAFAEYSSVVGWLAAAAFVSSIGYPFASSLQAIDRPDLNFRIRTCVVSLVIIGALLVAPVWGLLGIAIIQFSGSLLSLLARVLLFNRLVQDSTVDTVEHRPTVEVQS